MDKAEARRQLAIAEQGIARLQRTNALVMDLLRRLTEDAAKLRMKLDALDERP